MLSSSEVSGIMLDLSLYSSSTPKRPLMDLRYSKVKFFPPLGMFEYHHKV